MDNFRLDSTLRNKLLTAFVLLVLLPAVIISIGSAVINWQNEQQRVIDQLNSIAILKEAEIERWVNSLQSNLAIALQDTEQDWLATILTSNFSSSDYHQAVGNVQDDWQRLVKYTSLFEELFLMDNQGRVVLSNGLTKVGTVHRNQLYFQEGVKGPYVHPPFYSPSQNRMSVVAVQPVIDNRGQTIGLLAGRASMAVLNEVMLERTGLGQTGETYLVGSNHALLTKAQFTPIDVQAQGAAVLFVRTTGANIAIDNRQNGSGLYSDYGDTPVIGVYRWLPKLQVALLAEQSQAEAFWPLYVTIGLNSGVALVAVIIAVGVALLIIRNMTTPLIDLAKTVMQINAGNLKLRLKTNRNDEIGLLAQAFNDMTTRLEEVIDSLQQREASLLEAQQIAKLGNFEFLLHTQKVRWSDETYHIFGLEVGQEITLERYQDLLAPEDFQRVMNAVGQAVAAKQPYTIEHDIILANGKRKHLFAIGRPILDETGQVHHIFGIVQDITERKRAEEEIQRLNTNLEDRIAERTAQLQAEVAERRQTEERLQTSEQRYRSLFENSPIALWEEDFSQVKTYLDELRQRGVTDFQNYFENHPEVVAHCATLVRVIDINTAGWKMQEAESKAELLNNLSNIFSPDAIIHFQEELLVIAEGGLKYESESVNQTLRGRTVHYRVGWSVLPGYETDLSQVIVFFLDITEQKHAEATLQQYHYHLEDLVEMRTTALTQTNAQLQQEIVGRKQTEAQLQTSLQEKEVLLKEIHHRVKNNMQIISSLLDLQADTIQDELIRGLFKESQQRIRSMALIHEQLYQSSDLARIDFAEYVERLTNHLLRSYGARAGNVALHMNVAPVLLSIETAIPCGLIINELVSNAFKHAFPNGRSGQIWITLQRTEAQQLTLQIKDNGVGFPPEIDFRRTPSLGLTLVNTLVKQVRGIIDLQRESHTEFMITFRDQKKDV